MRIIPWHGRIKCFCVSLLFVHVMFCVDFGGGPCTLQPEGGPPDVSVFINVVHKYFCNPDSVISDIKGNLKKKKVLRVSLTLSDKSCSAF